MLQQLKTVSLKKWGPMKLYALTAHLSLTLKSTKQTVINHNGIFRTPRAITLVVSIQT